ncbi:coiled-coil domain containing 79 [Plakobranchus ocellatus]|uniref:Coiled-coil domain containing 79 n=1 Tax=Plakobranchus ocellatus TaxID=259542 RepID=A0AAV4DID9_9GAST|nr:coiled-coil domain containing 79 [Plakobranchus ocellatus]
MTTTIVLDMTRDCSDLQDCSISPISSKADVYHFSSAGEQGLSSPHLDVSMRSVQAALKRKRGKIGRPNEMRRQRVPYSEQEIANLLEGVRTMGRRWQQILCSYNFHPTRTGIDLKDKFKRIAISEMEEQKQRRSMLPFSMCEVRRLKRGVKMFGYNWKAILAGSKFLPGRTSSDLRNKWKALNKVD